MNNISIVLGVIAIIMILSMVLCGLWLRTHPTSNPGALKFHFQLGLATLIVCLVAIILLLVKVSKG